MYFDYRRQRTKIYIANQDSSTVIALCKEWKNRFLEDSKMQSYTYISWYTTNTDNDPEITKYDKKINISGSSMNKLFEAFPVVFKQDIYVLLFEPYIPPYYWNKILNELYLSKQFGTGLCFVKGDGLFKLPICTGNDILKFPRTLQRRFHEGIIDKSFSLNKFEILNNTKYYYGNISNISGSGS